MAKLECDICDACGFCKYTNGHANECGVLLTEAYVSIVLTHEETDHAPLAVDVALRGNEIQVKRLFKDIVAPQVNAEAARILDQWLLNKDAQELPNDIPRLWK